VSAAVFGQPNSFTYQGQLKQQGSPLDDFVDMRFSLYDSQSAAEPVAGPIVFDGLSLPAVEVANGLFAVELDFGLAAFQQGGEWLKIEVRAPHSPDNIGPYTTLTPRQHITAAPFALSVPGLATTETGVEVEGDIHTPGEVTASAFSSNSPLVFKVNPGNVECARFEDENCFLGLGTVTPQAMLHIGGTPGVDGIMFPDGSLQTSAAGIGGGDGFWSPSGINIFNNNGGNVGIGASIPQAKLDVRGHLVLDPGGSPTLYTSIAPSEQNRYLHLINSPGFSSASGLKAGGVLVSDGYSYANPGKNDLIVKGNTGIGTNPAFRLHIENFGYGLVHSSGPVQVGTYASSGGGWLGTRSNHPLYLFTADSLQQVTLSTAGRLGIGHTDPLRRLHVRGDSIFAARFESPFPTATVTEFTNTASNNTWEYAVTGSTPPFGLGAGDLYLYRQGNGEPGLTISRDNFAASIRCADFFMGHPSRRGSPGRALVDFGDHLVVNFGTDWPYTFVHGRLKTNVLEVLGADISEKFLSSEDKVEPGTVMEIDPEQPGKLRIAREAYSSRVAGVVSGAGDNPAGAVLGSFPGSENAPAIALSGRVWVRCDATADAIAAGNLLTTSSHPGFAMKASDRERSHGAVLGKAMTPLAQGERGLVLVLVNLQ
jgi:hypothetical protein